MLTLSSSRTIAGGRSPNAVAGASLGFGWSRIVGLAMIASPASAVGKATRPPYGHGAQGRAGVDAIDMILNGLSWSETGVATARLPRDPGESACFRTALCDPNHFRNVTPGRHRALSKALPG